MMYSQHLPGIQSCQKIRQLDTLISMIPQVETIFIIFVKIFSKITRTNEISYNNWIGEIFLSLSAAIPYPACSTAAQAVRGNIYLHERSRRLPNLSRKIPHTDIHVHMRDLKNFLFSDSFSYFSTVFIPSNSSSV